MERIIKIHRFDRLLSWIAVKDEPQKNIGIACFRADKPLFRVDLRMENIGIPDFMLLPGTNSLLGPQPTN